MAVEPSASAEEMGPTVEYQPTTPIRTPQDRKNAIIIEVDDSLDGRVEAASNSLPLAIRDLYKSSVQIDHVECFVWNRSESVVFALVPFSAKIQNTKQIKLTEVTEYNDRDADDSLPEPVATLYRKLQGDSSQDDRGRLPESLNAHIGTIPFGMFGDNPAVTARVVMDGSNRKLTHSHKVDGAGLEELLSEYKNEPFLYYAHLRRNTKAPENFEYQITVRIALFDPKHRIATEEDYKTALQYGRSRDPALVFDKLGTESSLSLIDNNYGIAQVFCPGSLFTIRSSPFSGFQTDKDLITGDVEYQEILRGGYGAPDTLEESCSWTSLLAREADLEKFLSIGAAPSDGDPWEQVPMANPLGVNELGADISALRPEPVSIPAETDDLEASKTPSTANDGTKRHWIGIKKAAASFKSEGYRVWIVTQDTGSRPDLWVKSPSGEIYAVEVELTTRSKAGSFYTNLTRNALWGYKTIVVMVPRESDDGRTESLDTIATWAINRLAKPMKDLDGTNTKLHNLAKDITIDGKTMLLPEGVTESEWWLTPKNQCLLVGDDEILAEGHATDPLEDFEFYTPRCYIEEDKIIVEEADGTRLQIVDEPKDVLNTKASPCHRPIDLSYLEFVEALYCLDFANDELIKQDIIAGWDTDQASERHEKSIDDAFSTFVVDREEDVDLPEAECYPFIKNWIANLSAHGGPAKNVYGEYRKLYYPRKSNNAKVGKNHWYPGASFRYDRGLVSPDLPGLSTSPSFPDEWDVDPDEVLREPLIYGVDDRDDILEEGPSVQ